MIDPNDKATNDLFGKKRRGRPVTGKAKPDKQRMREYRQRKQVKQASATEVTLSAAQFEMMTRLINQLTKERDEALQQLQDEREKHPR